MATFRKRRSRKYRNKNTRRNTRKKYHKARKSRINRRTRKSLEGGTAKAQVTRKEMLVSVKDEVTTAVNGVVKAVVYAGAADAVVKAAERAATVEVAKATKKVDTEEEWLRLESEELTDEEEKEWNDRDKSKMDESMASNLKAAERRQRWMTNKILYWNCWEMWWFSPNSLLIIF